MLIVERQRRLLEILKQRRSAQLDDLASHLGVSSSTIRRDLEQLEKQRLVERTHGGAVYVDDQPTVSNRATMSLAARMQERVSEKQAIARYAASLVEPDMTLLLDGGSTIVMAAQCIEARPIQVVTTSLSVANIFKEDDEVELLLAGGSLYPRSEVTVGPITTATLAELHADVLMLSLAGIEGDAGYNINLSMARVEQVMLQQATHSVMLMDSAKFGRKSLTRVCSVRDVDKIVTDQGVDQRWRDAFGQRLVVVDEQGRDVRGGSGAN